MIKTTIITILLFMLCCLTVSEAKTFKIATYNVQNLFDLTHDGTEYPEYIPNTHFGWTRDMVDIKITNIAMVIKDLKADIISLQEVESKKSLVCLTNRLKTFNVNYPYFEIADDSKTVTIKCAVLSKYPIIKKEEIKIKNKLNRNILKVTLDIEGNRLVLFINHWKSKKGPESYRIDYAKALKKAIDKLKNDEDFVLIGDFNSNYNEYKTFVNNKKLNNTNDITGINHILRTITSSKIVNEKILTIQPDNEYLYNLWLEVNMKRRWSYNFFGNKSSPDNIILSKGLYNDKGISYIDNSFDKFDPDYLFNRNAIYRWQRTKKGKGRHTGAGYSDHLPIFAIFSTEPFRKDPTPVIKKKSKFDFY
ncbi:MAG: endonuclease/exonuclease/phosphatase family protein [Deltaproteobacteria bacterium]|nr:endonuclease/exonuclease/phosphatase family protein [Deltaproteobacteria bacterium]MBW2662088.1 endonuclease/exonuclease/phosphatase family protein [Deltaproteobacteria bacterium]